MTGDNHEGRLSTVEANIKNIDSGITEIKNHLREDGGKREEFRTEVIQRLTKIETSHQDYQSKCDKDREDYRKRIESLEGTRNQQKGAFGMGKLMAGGIGGLIVAAIDYFAGKH